MVINDSQTTPTADTEYDAYVRAVTSRDYVSDDFGDQTAKKDKGKLRLSLVPMKILYVIAEVREFAVRKKYKDPDNWKRVEIQRYRDAALRHFIHYIINPKSIDPESGLPTLWHVACNIAFIVDMERYDKEDEWEKTT